MTLTSQGGCVLPSVCDTGGEKDFVFLFFFPGQRRLFDNVTDSTEQTTRRGG